MTLSLSTLFIMVNVFAVLTLAITPIVFFSVYAEESQEWKIAIPSGASGDVPAQTFVPNELPVHVGDTIIWENLDSVSHSITSGLPDYPEHSGMFFDIGEIKPGDSTSHVLTNPDYNAFYYFCEIHPWMTGKIFVADLEIAMPETANPILTDESSYTSGETVLVSGQVHQDFAKTEYNVLVYDQKNNLVENSHGYFADDATYLYSIDMVESSWNSGAYQVKLVYGVPSKVAQTSFEVSNLQNDSIPSWIKNIGKFWCNEQIGDSDFVGAVQYLIQQDIIRLTNAESNTHGSEQVPSWVKNNACWWSQNQIPDVEFISGIEYLVNIGTITV